MKSKCFISQSIFLFLVTTHIQGLLSVCGSSLLDTGFHELEPFEVVICSAPACMTVQVQRIGKFSSGPTAQWDREKQHM